MNRLAPALVCLASIALLATGCGSDAAADPPKVEKGHSYSDTGSVITGLKDGGLCTDPADPELLPLNEGVFSSSDSPEMANIVKTEQCAAPFLVKVTSFTDTGARDRVAVLKEGSGGGHYYKGTGTNPWILYVHDLANSPAVMEALDNELVQIP